MRKIYLILTITICVSIILFVATFFYIDTHRHTVLYYNIYQEGELVSSVKLDKYNTEDKTVYKSVTSTPFHSTYNRKKRNLSIDKKGSKVHSYNKKHLSEGVSLDIYIKRIDSHISFLAVGHSNFAYAKRLPIKNDFAIFEQEAIVSYFNLMERYDFKRGGAQNINCLSHSYTFLPPYKNNIEMRFIGEEIVKVGAKKIKAYHFRLRPHNKEEVHFWINRWTHTPIMIRAPKPGFEAILVDRPAEITTKRYIIAEAPYREREVAFKNKEITLAGALSVPKGKGPFPAAILAWGPGPQDRNSMGIFTDIADGLARNGIAVLRFDKRGVGKSEGDFSRFTGEDLTNDLSSAVDFLLQEEEIDKERIAILGHSEGGYYAALLAAENPNISACIIMSGMEAINLPDTDLETTWSFDKSALKWDKEYLDDITGSAKDTYAIVNSGKDWVLLLHKRVFLKKCRLDIEKNPLEVIRKIKVPVLLLKGKKDTVIPLEHIRLLEEALKEGGNENYEVKYFNRLNYFFGKKIEDRIHRTRIAVDKEAVDAMVKWLNKVFAPPPIPAIEKNGGPIDEKDIIDHYDTSLNLPE